MAEIKLINVPKDSLEKLLAEVKALVAVAEGKTVKAAHCALDAAHKEFEELRVLVGFPRLG